VRHFGDLLFGCAKFWFVGTRAKAGNLKVAATSAKANSNAEGYEAPLPLFCYEYQNKGVTDAKDAKNINLKDLVMQVVAGT
jgi:hypothetical protein